MNRKKISLKNGLLLIIVLCWLIPIGILFSLAGFLLGRSYQESAEQMIRANADYAIQQVQRQLSSSVEDSKSISYDGVVRNACRRFEERGDRTELYQHINEYLTQKFSRIMAYKAVFLNFWLEEPDLDVYVLNSSAGGYGLLQECREQGPRIRELMANADTDVRFLAQNGNLFVARNLLNSRFEPYATVVLMVEPKVVFAPLDGLSRIQGSQIRLDDVTFFLGENGKVIEQEPVAPEQADISYYLESGGHSYSFCADLTDYSLLRQNPWLLLLAAVVGALVLPLLFVVIALFQRHISRPAEMLAQANQKVEDGNRGYEIPAEAPNEEFSDLFSHFNAMSKELENQFERAYLEQQATQRAQIKALQSQINPHFLNNTLEVINWEARLSGNDHISEMIEALSTMLGAALDRKGRNQIPLQEELGYVDAYLKIIKWRVGDGFHVYKDIEPQTQSVVIPRLILQPIVENAVEHDISRQHGGNLWLRAYCRQDCMVVEVEHDGSLTREDQENISRLLKDKTPGTHVGLQNVSQRLCLIYGRDDLIELTGTDHDTIIARLSFPVNERRSAERSQI